MRYAGENSGFTLVELMIALCLMSIALYLVSPSLMGASERSVLAASANDISNTLRRARADAIAHNRQSTVTFDMGQRAYWRVGYRRPTALDQRISVTVKSLTQEQRAPLRTQIRFFPDGSSSGGMVRLRIGNSSVRMDVDWMTGHVVMRKAL